MFKKIGFVLFIILFISSIFIYTKLMSTTTGTAGAPVYFLYPQSHNQDILFSDYASPTLRITFANPANMIIIANEEENFASWTIRISENESLVATNSKLLRIMHSYELEGVITYIEVARTISTATPTFNVWARGKYAVSPFVITQKN